MKYSPVMAEMELEHRRNSDTPPELEYVFIFPDNQREPELTERLLKARRETREKYYASLSAKEVQHEGNRCTDADQTSHAEHDE